MRHSAKIWSPKRQRGNYSARLSFSLAHPPAVAGSFRKETELPVSHKGGMMWQRKAVFQNRKRRLLRRSILLKIESLYSGLTVFSRPGKAHTSETTSMPSRERTPRKPSAYPSHKSSFRLARASLLDPTSSVALSPALALPGSGSCAETVR